MYYRDPTMARILHERTGFDTRLPVDGIEMDNDDKTLELLAEVAEAPEPGAGGAGMSTTNEVEP